MKKLLSILGIGGSKNTKPTQPVAQDEPKQAVTFESAHQVRIASEANMARIRHEANIKQQEDEARNNEVWIQLTRYYIERGKCQGNIGAIIEFNFPMPDELLVKLKALHYHTHYTISNADTDATRRYTLYVNWETQEPNWKHTRQFKYYYRPISPSQLKKNSNEYISSK